MKKIPTVVLLYTPYLFIVIFLARGPIENAFIPWAVLWLVVGLPNIIYAFFLPRLKTTARELFFWDMMLKLCSIPAWVGTFFLILIFNQIMVSPALFWVIFYYSLLWSSSAYGISGLLLKYRKGEIDVMRFCGGLMLHFFCFGDLFIAISCYISERKNSQ